MPSMSTTFFWEHYINYLSEPSTLVTFSLGLILLYFIWQDCEPATSTRWPFLAPARSNLAIRRDVKAAAPEDRPRVQALFVYPIKSCSGVEVSASRVTATGLVYDRLFSFAHLVPDKTEAGEDDKGRSERAAGVERQWRFITQREFPRLALLEVEIELPPRKAKSQEPHDNGGLIVVVRFPWQDKGGIFRSRTETVTIRLPILPTTQRAKAKGYSIETMTIWRDCPLAINVTSEIDTNDLAKLRCFLGVSNPLGLFRVSEDHLRTITRSLPKDRADDNFRVGFADAFPVSLINTASVETVQDNLPAAKYAASDRLDPRRFRGNIYITGPPAFAEDEWLRMIIGNGYDRDSTSEYHAACRTARCVLVNVDQDTGVDDRKEPFATLKRTRQVDEGARPHPCLGLSMIPLFEQGVIRVGDQIDVTRTGEHYYEKMFA